MRGAVLYGPRDVRFEERDVPRIIKLTDAIIRIAAPAPTASTVISPLASTQSSLALRRHRCCADVHLHGGPAPVRRYLPELIKLVWDRKINPGKVFDVTLPLDEVAEAYRAMDERRAIKTLLRP